MSKENNVDVEKEYKKGDAAKKLRRLADALEQNKAFEIQIAGNRIYVPTHAEIEFEYEQNGDEQEIEIEIKWKRKDD